MDSDDRKLKEQINQKRLYIEDRVKNTTIESLIDTSDYYAREELRKALRIIRKVEHAIGNIESYAVQQQVVSGENTEQVYRKAHELAGTIFTTSLKDEPNISKDLESLESFTSILVNKEYRIKELKSLEDKIVGDTIERLEEKPSFVITDEDLEESADNIKDGIRYTYVIDDSLYTKKTEEILNSLEQMGYDVVRFNNVWTDDKYKGINCILTSPTNTLLEIQFHTLDSLVAKELTHLMYEIARNKNSSETIANICNDAQTCINAGVITLPDNVLGFDYKPYNKELDEMFVNEKNQEKGTAIKR